VIVEQDMAVRPAVTPAGFFVGEGRLHSRGRATKTELRKKENAIAKVSVLLPEDSAQIRRSTALEFVPRSDRWVAAPADREADQARVRQHPETAWVAGPVAAFAGSTRR